MADLARALNTPVPAQPAPQQPASRTPAGPDPRAAPTTTEVDPRREARNKRDQQRRKEKRAADLKAAQEAAAKPKKKRKAKKKAAYRASDRAVMKQLPKLVAKKKVRGRGRPPGSKNKPKAPLMDTVFPPQMRRAPAEALQGELSSALATMRAIELQLAKHTPADRAAIIAALA